MSEELTRESDACYVNSNGYWGDFECYLESYVGYLQLVSIIIALVVFIPALITILASFRPLIKVNHVKDSSKQENAKKDKIVVENIGNRIARKVKVTVSSTTHGPYMMGPGESKEIEANFSKKTKVVYKRYKYGFNFKSYFDSTEKVRTKIVAEDIRTIAGRLRFSRFLKKCRKSKWTSDTIYIRLDQWADESAHLSVYSIGKFQSLSVKYHTKSRFEDILFIICEIFGENFIEPAPGFRRWETSKKKFNELTKKRKGYLKLNKLVFPQGKTAKDIFYKIESRKNSSYSRKEISSKVQAEVDRKTSKFAIDLDYYKVFDVDIQKVHKDRWGIIFCRSEVDLHLISSINYSSDSVAVVLYNRNFTTSNQKEKYKFDETTYRDILEAVDEFKQMNSVRNINMLVVKIINVYKSLASIAYWSFKDPICKFSKL